MKRITDADRKAGPAGSTLWLTGLPAAGKTTVAYALKRRLAELGSVSVLLDGDELRRGLSGDLGVSPEDRSEQARRTAHVAALIARSGPVAIVSLISPYASDRERAREIHEAAGIGFHEIWIDTPLQVCQERDPKGLYARARVGAIRDMTGVDAPYEPPSDPDVHICASECSPEDAAGEILRAARLILSETVPAG